MKSLILSLIVAVSLTACSNYGKKVKSGNIEVYYKDGTTEAEAQKTADLFLQALQATNPDAKDTKSFQLTKPNDTVLLKMVVGDKEKMNAAGDEIFYAVAGIVSDSVYKGNPVNISLTDNSFKPFRTLVFRKPVVENYGEKITAGNIDVYAKGGFSYESAQQLAEYLNKSIAPANTISFQISKDESGFYLLKMVSSPDKAGALTNNDLREMCSSISDGVFLEHHLSFN